MYMRPYGPGLISAINRFWPKLSLTGVLQPGDEVIICVHFVQYSCFWHAGLLRGKKWSGFLALSKIWIIELKNFVCICVMILLHHFCQKNFWPKFSLTGVLHPGDDIWLPIRLVLPCRVSEILELLYAESHFFRTTPLFGRIFWCVPLGVDPWCLGCKERTSQANWWWNYFRRIPTHVITIYQRYRQTDRRHAIARPRFAL